MLSSSHKSLAEEFEKMAVKPTGDKNWCDLPYEMKKECMKWMDLPTKFRMRRTGRMEKEIFDEVKFSIVQFEILINDKIRLSIIDNNRMWILTSVDVDPVDTFAKCAAFVLKSAERINQVLYTRELEEDSSSESEVSLLNELEQCDSFRFSLLCFSVDVTIDVPLCLLKKCSLPLGYVSVGGKACGNSDPFLAMPQFTAAKHIAYTDKIGKEQVLQIFSEIAQKWIENDAPIGNKADANRWRNPALIVRLAERFADRLVCKDRSGIRIRTDNPDKHIAFNCGTFFYQNVVDASEPLWSDGDESDYDYDGYDSDANVPVGTVMVYEL